MEKNQLKIIISGGGTGGHIFPAISIANELVRQRPDINILFVGAEGRMEMEKVPKAGYNIVGLPVVGFQRKLTLANLKFPFKLISSLLKARKVVRNFKPNVAVGVGGYASGPILKAAQRVGIPTLLQEQNSYAGITNKLLAKQAKTICVAYEGMDKYFPADKIILTGNPVRSDLENITVTKTEALSFFNIPSDKKVILVLGGSLGARTINQSLIGNLELIRNAEDVVVIWQTGKYYYNELKSKLDVEKVDNIRLNDFINQMNMAYAAADLVISRAGAGTISELCLVAKPSILIPSPNVAEDHQTRNAEALSTKNAAIMVKDSDAVSTLINIALATVRNSEKLNELKINIAKMALPNSAKIIAEEVLKLADNK
ncbi:MAG TPA: undecaprenyldiphospho-muramoylpentapeptide beta-N-acetylglucosaminyltransferase [Tenuifilaceae bacterium]|nr:undecaprenyldiphospho-muramoylpentapeptide beta-N-acetylglucosaminyltransferase [Tenuifilaceae bacterium]